VLNKYGPISCGTGGNYKEWFFLLSFCLLLYNPGMLYVWLVILVLLNACWLGLVFFGLPGNWLIVISASLFAWWRADDEVFSIYTLAVVVLLALVGEVIEFLAGAGGARRAGAGWKGSAAAIGGAIIGGIAGTFVMPFFGTLIGACLGAGAGAWAVGLTAGHEMQKSIRIGVGAGLGQFIGITGKFVIGVVIWLIVTIAAFRP